MSACATTSGPDSDELDVAGAASQPLRDFNLQRVEVPAVLQAALADPYRPPAGDCARLAQELAELDKALGPDLDIEPAALDEDGDDLVEGVVRDAATGWIPFRSVVRRMTGAEARDRRAEAAGIAGAIRRGYLKGFGERQGCAAPAAPVRTAAPVK